MAYHVHIIYSIADLHMRRWRGQPAAAGITPLDIFEATCEHFWWWPKLSNRTKIGSINKPNHDVSCTLTKCFLCLNPSRTLTQRFYERKREKSNLIKREVATWRDVQFQRIFGVAETYLTNIYSVKWRAYRERHICRFFLSAYDADHWKTWVHYFYW